ncbi:LA_0991 family prenyltransferase-like protein [Leptospira noguchii]|uniref:LA_0991 family prenyltransferase-like protein n=1 Tax=Leptospira noguchii TaxID=28182 RepID=UPI0007742BD8|nr:hypothetical protein [Leptospira noguchii]UOG61193.1 hypothetical protein MAL07_03875 [Leptospira noguchii]
MFYRIFYYWNVLSIDIVCGAVSSVWFASYVLNSDLKTEFWILLPATVWVIYSADHWIDGWKLGKKSTNPRHEFYYKNRIFLIIMTGLTGIFCFICGILFIEKQTLLVALAIGIFVAIHLVCSYFQVSFFWKECSVAILYTAGIWFAPILSTSKTDWKIWCGLFFLTTLCNSFVNSYMEIEMDRKENAESILRWVSQKTLKKSVITLSGIGTVFNLIWLYKNQWAILPEFFYLSFGYLIPVNILFFESFFQKKQLYRILGEGTFILACIPVIFRKLYPI